MEKSNNWGSHPLIWLIIIVFLVQVPPIGIILLIAEICLLIYSSRYFKSEIFFKIKNNIISYVNDCNELNLHIEELRSAYIDVKN